MDDRPELFRDRESPKPYIRIVQHPNGTS